MLELEHPGRSSQKYDILPVVSTLLSTPCSFALTSHVVGEAVRIPRVCSIVKLSRALSNAVGTG